MTQGTSPGQGLGAAGGADGVAEANEPTTRGKPPVNAQVWLPTAARPLTLVPLWAGDLISVPQSTPPLHPRPPENEVNHANVTGAGWEVNDV